jgi:hypothetical protein
MGRGFPATNDRFNAFGIFFEILKKDMVFLAPLSPPIRQGLRETLPGNRAENFSMPTKQELHVPIRYI